MQLKSKELGAVVEVLDPKDMEKIFIPVPSESVQAKIGSVITEAYNKRDCSNQLEAEATTLLERKLEEIVRDND